MGDVTNIAWTDSTFNPWLGCEKVSAGCKNCYAENDTPIRDHRGKGLELWGGDAARVVTGADNWKKPARWNREAQAAGRRHRVFCASLADVFEDRRDLDAPRARLFALIEQTPWLDWQLVTKRPENMVRLATASWAERWPANVWAGCTVEDQPAADERVPWLRDVPAAVRFLSMEPLIAPVVLADDSWDLRDGFLHWLIVGGESGSKARPFDLAWARAIVAQCRDAGVACFVKQLGARPETDQPTDCHGRLLVQKAAGHVPNYQVHLRDSHGGDPAEWPSDLRVREFPTVAT